MTRLWVVAGIATAAAYEGHSSGRNCTSRDYRPVYGRCGADGMRNVSYVRDPAQHAGANCDGLPAITPASGSQVQCVCELPEYVPSYGPCDRTFHRDVRGYKSADKDACTREDALVEQLPVGEMLCPCSATDVGSDYTECSPESLTRLVVFYWNRVCQPGEEQTVLQYKPVGEPLGLFRHSKRGSDSPHWIILDGNNVLKDASPHRKLLDFVGQELVAVVNKDVEAGESMPVPRAPVNITEWEEEMDLRSIHHYGLVFRIDLPEREILACHLDCPAGTYLAPPLTQCAFCPAGQYAIPGKIYTAPWRKWPSEMHTYCAVETEGSCQEWRLRGDYIDSGEQVGHTQLVSAVSFRVDVKRVPAVLKVTYRMESGSGQDYMQIRVDDVPLHFATGNEPWTTVSFDLSHDVLVCGWTLHITAPETLRHHNDTCVWRNRFMPYKPALYFNPEGGETKQMTFALAKNEGCLPSDYEGQNFTGKVAFVRRRTCHFDNKTLHAQMAGAIGIVIHNHRPHQNKLWMAGESAGLHIPALFISYERGLPILQALTRGEEVKASVKRAHVTLGQMEVQIALIKTSSPNARVFVKEITVDGSLTAATSCTDCSPGTYSHGGFENSSGCIPCPPNTFANATGMHKCNPCTGHATSPPGAKQCTRAAAPCEREDFRAVYGPCTGSPPEITVTWEPHNCNPDLPDSKVPQPVRIKCGPGDEGDECLLPGMYRVNQSTCLPCGGLNVTIADPTEPTRYGSCQVCNPDVGFVPTPMLDYSRGFAKLPALVGRWNTKCSADALGDGDAEGCLHSTGWQLLSWSRGDAARTDLVAGRNLRNAEDVSLSLELTLHLAIGGYLNFTYELQDVRGNDLQHVSVKFTVYDNTDQTVAARSADLLGSDPLQNGRWTAPLLPGNPTSKYIELPAGNYTVSWEYEKDEKTSADVVFLLSAMTVVGDFNDPAISCTRCPADVNCTAKIPVPCPVGYRRDPSSTSKDCFECGIGTTPGAVSGRNNCPDGCPDGTSIWNADGVLRCGLGTTAACTVEHRWNGTVDNWDLSLLGGIQSERLSEGWSATGKVHVSLCDFVNGRPNSTVCKTRTGRQQQQQPESDEDEDGDGDGEANGVTAVRRSYACIDQPEQVTAFSLGDTLEVRWTDQRQPTYRISNGDRCPADPSRRLSAVVILDCDPGAVHSAPPNVTVTDGCTFIIHHASARACPQCHNDSYQSVIGACEGGQRLRTWVWPTGRPTCFGGFAKPLDDTQECTSEIHVSKPLGIAIVVVGVLLFCACVAFVVYKVCKLQSLQVKYQQLERGEGAFDNLRSNDLGVVVDGSGPPSVTPPPEFD